MSRPLTFAERETLSRIIDAAREGDLALIATEDAATGEHRAVIAIGHRDPDGGATFVPLGHLSADPFAEYAAPDGAEIINEEPDNDTLSVRG